jgi:hypothetical protein
MAARILFRLTELKQAGWQAESLTTCLPLEGGWSTSFPLADDDRPETAADVGIDCPQFLGGFLRA